MWRGRVVREKKVESGLVASTSREEDGRGKGSCILGRLAEISEVGRGGRWKVLLGCEGGYELHRMDSIDLREENE